MKKSFEIGLIRVVTLEDNQLLNLHGKIIEDNFPGLKVESKCLPDQITGIHSPETKEIAIPKILKLTQEFKNKDMIIVSCADDPGVELIRKEFPNIPVVGAGESTAALAQKYGTKIALLGITDYAPDPYIEVMQDKIIDIGKPEGINCTLDLMTEEGRKSVIKKAKEQKAMGAQVIALACTGMSTIEIAKVLEEEVQLPVIDPVLSEGLFAYFEYIRNK